MGFFAGRTMHEGENVRVGNDEWGARRGIGDVVFLGVFVVFFDVFGVGFGFGGDGFLGPVGVVRKDEDAVGMDVRGR